MVILKTRYQCRYCAKSFAREDRYLDHECKLMKRDEEFKTPIGQAAWSFYQHWLTIQRRMVPASESFLSSKYYNSFVKFARFVHQVQLPDTDLFIKLMKDKDISPVMWCMDDIYASYLEHLDRTVPPLKQSEISVNTLLEYADNHQIDVSKVFEIMTGSEIIDLLAKRKLSPWLLLFSAKFGALYSHKASAEQKIKMDTPPSQRKTDPNPSTTWRSILRPSVSINHRRKNSSTTMKQPAGYTARQGYR